MMADLKGEYLFTWKIENFSLCALRNPQHLESPTFKAESLGGSEWYLQLFPKGNTIGKENFVSLFLYRVQNDDKEITDFKLEMNSVDGRVLESFETIQAVNNVGIGWKEFIARDILADEMKCWKKDVLTIRCYMKNQSKLIAHADCGSEAWTKIGADRCCFLWSVHFCDSSNFRSNKVVFIRKRTQFEFILIALGDEIDIEIRRIDKETSKAKVVACEISLMNIKGTEVESKKEIHTFKGDGAEDAWKFPTLLSKKTLIKKKFNLIKNNTFTLKCDVSASTGESWSEFKNIKYEVISPATPNDSFSALQEDLRNTFKTKKNSDITLRVGSSIIPAHKYILCSRSPVFNAIIYQKMQENKTGIIDIKDVDSETFNSFLEFLYTGCVSEWTFENTMKLMIAAEKYQVSSLIEQCSTFLMSALSVQNVCDVYAFGDRSDHKFLKSSAYKFIADNSAIMLPSNVWCNWMKANVGLANEILYQLALDSTR